MTPPPLYRHRQHPADRKAAILAAAVILAETHGYTAISLVRVAIASGVSQALVSHYYQTASDLRTAVMHEAVRRRVLSVVGEGLAHRHPVAMTAPQALKQEAALTLAGGEV